MGWTSVKTKFPEETEKEYLVTDGKKTDIAYFGNYYGLVWPGAGDVINSAIWIIRSETQIVTESITHWMPLPEPPP